MTRPRPSRLILALVTSIGLLAGCTSGDSDIEQFDGADIKPADPGAHDHGHDHDHEAPHGGELIELASHAYHAEIVFDEKTHSISVYLLDGEAEKGVGIPEKELTLTLSVDEKQETHKLLAQPQEGDESGTSSRFTTTGDAAFERFHDDEDLAGTVDVAIKGKKYSIVVKHDDHDDHDHDHDAKHKKGEDKDHDKGKETRKAAKPASKD